MCKVGGQPLTCDEGTAVLTFEVDTHIADNGLAVGSLGGCSHAGTSFPSSSCSRLPYTRSGSFVFVVVVGVSFSWIGERWRSGSDTAAYEAQIRQEVQSTVCG